MNDTRSGAWAFPSLLPLPAIERSDGSEGDSPRAPRTYPESVTGECHRILDPCLHELESKKSKIRWAAGHAFFWTLISARRVSGARHVVERMRRPARKALRFQVSVPVWGQESASLESGHVSGSFESPPLLVRGQTCPDAYEGAFGHGMARDTASNASKLLDNHPCH